MSPTKQPKSSTFATRLPSSSDSPTMPPEPALSFTIPSIHDDTTTLECRLFHPHSSSPLPRNQAAVIAHPYAPLGGCFDDAIVETLTAVLLRQGFVVGTFNFRGAGRSTGRASWTSKAETADYVSFAAFMCYYLHYLDHDVSSSSSTATAPSRGHPLLLLCCGYSYGAMITQRLPPLPYLLAPFSRPKTASSAADIRLRAQHLAEKQNRVFLMLAAAAAKQRSPTSPTMSAGLLRVGGEEDLRRSQELGGRRSFSLDADDKIRKGVAELMARAVHHQKRARKMGEMVVEEDGTDVLLSPVADMVIPRVGYVLVSPPIGWATSLLTLNLGGGGFFGLRRNSKATPPPPLLPKTPASSPGGGGGGGDATATRANQATQKLLDNPTLAIYGDADVFVTAKRFREWASQLQAVPGSKFRAHEVSTAGHFYVQEGTLQRLADAVRVFAGEMSRELAAAASGG